MIYVALLRGINVGGHSKVAMPVLKTVFESLGYEKVRTYINSGNVIFSTSDTSVPHITATVEAAIKREFGFAVHVVVIDKNNFDTVAHAIPAEWQNDTVQRTDVMFLWDEINSAAIVEQFKIDPTKETLLYCNGALVWNIGRENVMKGAMIKVIKTDMYKKMTIRNSNTVRKLAMLMAEAAND